MTTDWPLPPHASDAASILRHLDVVSETGLDAEQAFSRYQRVGPNALRERPRATALQVLLSQLNNPIVYLLLTATALALILGEWVESAFVLIVLVINTLIGFATEWQAIRSMDALRDLSGHTARVRRDGVVGPLPATQLVPGDIVLLSAGELVSADMRLLSSAGLTANESALTGEAFPIVKNTDALPADTILAERRCMVYQGTAITAGSAEAVVTATGMQTELGHISELVETAQPERTPLERQLAELSRHLIWLTLAVTAVLVLTGYLAGRDLVLMLQTALALAVAAIPEGLPIVATLALARGVLRMARHNALVEHLPTVETLGATTMILTDKTGTLTENDMQVERIVTAAGSYRGQGTDQPLSREEDHSPGSEDIALAQLLRNAALCNDASLGGEGIPASGDTMEIALLRVAATEGVLRAELDRDLPRLDGIAFQTDTRMMATLHRVDDTTYRVAVKGAPEAVLDCCDFVLQGGEQAPMDTEHRRDWQARCDSLASGGLRLLAVAGKSLTAVDVAPDSEMDPLATYSALTLYGIVAFQDPPRADVAPAIADAQTAGIAIVMVTGDHAATATHIAERVGIDTRGQPGVGGQSLGKSPDWNEHDRKRLRGVRVFSRLAPVQKLDLIKLHQEAGEVVAMTGDGVNDAPALRQADIGIAMGQRGTQVARQAAQLVLRDDAFTTIVLAMREGRTIYTNIRRFATYLLSCNLSEILLIGIAVIANLPLPLLPLQVLFLNLVTDVFPAFALGTVEADENVMKRPPRPPAEPILARKQWSTIIVYGLGIALVTLAALLLGLYAFDLHDNALTTVCFNTLALTQLWHVFNMRNYREHLHASRVTRNRYVWLAVIVCVVLLAGANLIPWVATPLQLVPLSALTWAMLLALSLLPVAAHELVSALCRLRTANRAGSLAARHK